MAKCSGCGQMCSDIERLSSNNNQLRQQLEQAEQTFRDRIKADRLHCLKHGDEFAQDMARRLEQAEARVAELEKVVAKSKTALRKHRWCGDCYPENGWPEVNDALASVQRLRQQAAEIEGGDDDKP